MISLIIHDTLALALAVLLQTNPTAADPPTQGNGDRPDVVAANREDLKRRLEESKRSRARLPLPPPTEEEIAEANRRASGSLGGIINNGRMRKLYLPQEFALGGFDRRADPAMTATSAFKTEIFWIVSRINNCAYCQGHQEVKLASEGLTDDQIASLDGDWSEMTPERRAAFEFVEKVSKRPDLVAEADVAALRPYYSDIQILEILYTIAGNNAMNRWTGSLAIPQEDHRLFLTPTAEGFAKKRSRVAPLDPTSKDPACAPMNQRGPLPDRSVVERRIEEARGRRPRIGLADIATTRRVLSLSDEIEPTSLDRLLANFPVVGPTRRKSILASRSAGVLDRRIAAEIAYVAALHDRAWYALNDAKNRLIALGIPETEIAALGEIDKIGDHKRRVALSLAAKITVDPARITDEDIEKARRLFSDKEVAEIVFQSAEAASLDRLTEVAGLPVER
ncbi:MAG: hypothetical protein SFX72_10830 [Isosphaeraceae bacterium]|nr:hypothetical protein [Isosphaeraceae bacterium]